MKKTALLFILLSATVGGLFWSLGFPNNVQGNHVITVPTSGFVAGPGGSLGNTSGYAWSSNIGWIKFRDHANLVQEPTSPIAKPFALDTQYVKERSYFDNISGDVKNFLFISDGRYFYKYDNDDPVNPVFLDSFDFGAAANVKEFTVKEFLGGHVRAYVALNGSSEISVLDINDSGGVIIENQRLSDGSGGFNGINQIIDGFSHLYLPLGAGGPGYTVVDIANKDNAVVVNTIPIFDAETGYVYGCYLFLAGDGQLSIRDRCANLTNPPEVGHLTDPLINVPYKVGLNNNYAFLTIPNTHSICAIDIGDIFGTINPNPTVAHCHTDSVNLNDVGGIQVMDGFLYVTPLPDSDSNYLAVVDFGNFNAVSLVDSVTLLGSGVSEPLLSQDSSGKVYVANNSKLYIYDIPYRYTTSVSKTDLGTPGSEGSFRGYAWSSEIGWISFNGSETGPSLDGTVIGKLDLTPGGTFCGSQYNVCGWARVLSACWHDLWDDAKCTGSGAGDQTGDWDGWIKLRDTAFDGESVVWNPATQELYGWAWGSDVVGWISFNDVTDGGSDHEVSVFLFPGLPPPPPDNVPTVSIAFPAAGVVSGVVTIQADASDIEDADGSLTVEYSVNGGASWTSMPSIGGTLYEATWDTTTVADGPYTIEVRATDSFPQSAEDFLSVTVDNIDSPPVATITNPLDGSTVSGTVTVQVDATDVEDPVGSLDVEFSIDGGAFSTMTYNAVTLRYEAAWDTTSVIDGSHTIDARATDDASNTGNAPQISVSVENVDSPPTISITSPAAGFVSGTVTIQADASDSEDADGSLTVAYTIDGGVTWNAMPSLGGTLYEATWDTSVIADGPYTIEVRATDSLPQSTTDSVGVSVVLPTNASFNCLNNTTGLPLSPCETWVKKGVYTTPPFFENTSTGTIATTIWTQILPLPTVIWGGPCLGKCDHAVQPHVPDTTYTVELRADNMAGSSLFTRVLTIKQDVEADFDCSLTGAVGTFVDCTTIVPPPAGTPLYFKDTSTPSQPGLGTTINTALTTWTFLPDGVPASDVGVSASSTAFSTAGPKTIMLTVTDSAGRSDTVTKTVDTSLPYPTWKEVSPL